jgi:sec-independent protein translocase protein TatA
MQSLLIGDIGTPELLIVLAIVILIFGASKLPELARGSGRALRIFKAETKGLRDDDDPAAPTTPGAPPTTAPREITDREAAPPPAAPAATPERDLHDR